VTDRPFDQQASADLGATTPGSADAGTADAVNTEALNDASADVGATAPESADARQGEGAEQAESGEHPDTALAARRLDDLQRLNAEYVNYKRRVDRDRAVVQERAVRDVLESMLPVLDDIQGARDAGDLTDGPFAAIADKLEGSLGKYGLVRFGAKGEAFDPTLHEALMHQAWPAGDADLADVPADQGTTIVTVLQSGFRTGDQVIRPARVAVADSE
jgi:molecular chaperone GrpE